MNKPAFNPNQPFEVAEKPPFDPNQPFQESQAIEPTSFLENAGKDLIGIYDAMSRGGQGIMDFPKDVVETGKQLSGGGYFANTPIGQDVSTLNKVGYGMPKALLQQGVDLAAEPFKHIPGYVGETMKKYYPTNPYYEHPVNSMLALAPLAKPLLGAVRAVPGVEEGLNAAQSGLRENLVAPNARRALGKFPSGMSTEQANQVGLTALDQGVIKNPLTNPLSSGREAMLNRATDINESLGENIGSFLKGQGENLDATKAMSELDKVKEQFMHDPLISRKVDQAKNLIMKNSSTYENAPLQVAIKLRGKTHIGNPGELHVDLINRVAKELNEDPNTVIDAIGKVGDEGFAKNGEYLSREQVKSMTGSRPESASLKNEGRMNLPEGPPTMEFSKANKLKSLLQKKVNYMSDAATQESGKAIAGNLRNSIDSQLDELSAKLGNREGMQQFKSDKSMFGKTRTMQDVLEKQAKRDERNMPISLPSVGVGVGGFIRGGGPMGALTALGAEWVKRYGSAAASSMINDVSKAIGGLGKDTAISPIAKAAPLIGQSDSLLKKKSLDEKTALEYLDKAGGDSQKALELMRADGY